MPILFWTGVLSLGGTLLVREIARRFKIFDRPDGGRKKHGRNVALWGGLPLFLVFWGVIIYELIQQPQGELVYIVGPLVALFYATLLFLLVGLCDDIRPVSIKLRFPLLIEGLLAVALAAPITKITN